MNLSRSILLAVFLIFSIAAQAEYPAGPVTDKERVLASLLAGKWMVSDYYTKDDFAYLRSVGFGCAAYVSDCPYTDSLGDPDRHEVRRTYKNFSGGVSTIETVAVTPQQYWELVRVVEESWNKGEHKLMMFEEPKDLQVEGQMGDSGR